MAGERHDLTIKEVGQREVRETTEILATLLRPGGRRADPDVLAAAVRRAEMVLAGWGVDPEPAAERLRQRLCALRDAGWARLAEGSAAPQPPDTPVVR